MTPRDTVEREAVLAVVETLHRRALDRGASTGIYEAAAALREVHEVVRALPTTKEEAR